MFSASGSRRRTKQSIRWRTVRVRSPNWLARTAKDNGRNLRKTHGQVMNKAVGIDRHRWAMNGIVPRANPRCVKLLRQAPAVSATMATRARCSPSGLPGRRPRPSSSIPTLYHWTNFAALDSRSARRRSFSIIATRAGASVREPTSRRCMSWTVPCSRGSSHTSASRSSTSTPPTARLC